MHCWKDFGCQLVIENGKPGATFVSGTGQLCPCQCRQTSVEKQGDQLEWEIEELGDRQPAAKDGGGELSKEHDGSSVLRCEATDRRRFSHEEQHPPDRHL